MPVGPEQIRGTCDQDRNGVVSHVERPSRGDGADNLEIEMITGNAQVTEEEGAAEGKLGVQCRLTKQESARAARQ